MNLRLSSFGAAIRHPLNPIVISSLFALYPAFVLVQRHLANGAAAFLVLLALFSLGFGRNGGKLERPLRWIFWSCVAYLLVALVNWALRGMTHADWLVLGRYARFLLLIPLFYLLRRYSPREGVFWWACLAGATIGGLWSIYESTTYLPVPGEPAVRVRGGTHNPIIFGDLSIMLGLLTACGLGYFSSKGRWSVVFALSALMLGVLGSFLSGSRGGWIVLPAAGLMGLWFASARINWKYQVAIVVAVIAIVIALLAIPGTGVYARTLLVFSEIRDYFGGEFQNTSVGYRIEMWRAAAEIIARHPLTGVGLDGYSRAVSDMVNEGLFNPAITQFGSPHNQFLNVFVSSGIMGLITMLAVFIAPLVYFWGAAHSRTDAKQRRIGIAGLMLLVAFCVFGLTESIFERATFITFFVLILSYLLARIASLRGGA